ncbi:MAG: hypothetical protein NC177_15400 [Ruminococcus flavefaciens]|nr:hypothetical protein [Ruminococcus flavefaciens]
MTNAQCLTTKIKNTAKKNGITIKNMLIDCGLSINTLNQMTDKKGISCFSLNKIADYLGVSVDYLLGRTDTPTAYSTGISDVQMNVNSPQGNNTINDKQETISAEDAELLDLIKRLPLKKRVKFISSLYDELEET